MTHAHSFNRRCNREKPEVCIVSFRQVKNSFKCCISFLIVLWKWRSVPSFALPRRPKEYRRSTRHTITYNNGLFSLWASSQERLNMIYNDFYFYVWLTDKYSFRFKNEIVEIKDLFIFQYLFANCCSCCSITLLDCLIFPQTKVVIPLTWCNCSSRSPLTLTSNLKIAKADFDQFYIFICGQ